MSDGIHDYAKTMALFERGGVTMPRKKAPVPTPKHVGHVDKMKRAAQMARPRKMAKPRVKVGTAAAKKLGIE